MGLDVYAISDHYRICTSSTRPSGIDVYEGLMIFETDTKIVRIYSSGAWEPLATLGGWTDFTPSWSNVVLGTSPVNVGRYKVEGNTLTFQAALKLGTGTGNVTGKLEMFGPSGITLRTQSSGLVFSQIGIGWAQRAATNLRTNAAFAGQPSTNMWVYRLSSGGAGDWDGTNPFNWDPGDELYVAGTMEID